MNDTSSLQQSNSVQNAEESKENTSGGSGTYTPQAPSSESSPTETKPSPPSSVSDSSGTSSANPTASGSATFGSSFIGQAWGDIDDSPSTIVVDTSTDTPKDTSKLETTLQEADTTDSTTSKPKSHPSSTRPNITPTTRQGAFGFARPRRGAPVRTTPAPTARRPAQNLSQWSSMRLAQPKDTGSPSMHGRTSGSPYLGGSTLSTPMSDLTLASRATGDNKTSRFATLAPSGKSYSLSTTTTTTSFAQVKETSATLTQTNVTATTSASTSNVWENRRREKEMQQQQLEEKRSHDLKEQAFLSEHAPVTAPPVPVVAKANEMDDDLERRIEKAMKEHPFQSAKAVKFYRDPVSNEVLVVKDANSSNAKLWNEEKEAAREEERRRLEEKLLREREEEERRKRESEVKKGEERRVAEEEERRKAAEEEEKRKEEEDKGKEMEKAKETVQASAPVPTPSPPSLTTSGVAPSTSFPDPAQSATRTSQAVAPHFTPDMTPTHSFDPAAYSQNSSEMGQSYIMPPYQVPPNMTHVYVPFGYPHHAMPLQYYYPHMYHPSYNRDMSVAQGEYGTHQAANRSTGNVTGDASSADSKRAKNPPQPFMRAPMAPGGMAPMHHYVPGYPMPTMPPNHIQGMVHMQPRHPSVGYRDYAPTDPSRLQKPQNQRTYNANLGAMHGADYQSFPKPYVQKQPTSAFPPQMSTQQRFGQQKFAHSPLQTIGTPFKPDAVNVPTPTGGSAVPAVANSSPPSSIPSTQTSGNESHVQ